MFIETALQLDSVKHHAVVECIPIPAELISKAKATFKQEIDASSSEWSQHYAKRLIDTSVKGLRGSIPPNFPYFAVEFGLSSGFVHVVDDESKFNRDLGRSVLVGLLRLKDEDMHRRAQRDQEVEQRAWASAFLKEWGPYDWTSQLE